MASLEYAIERLEPPLPDETASELRTMWETIFETDYSTFCEMLSGLEREANRDSIAVARHAGQIVASCHLTISLADPRVGGVGEVATLPDHRGRGLACALCGQAAEEFDAAGGEGLFLATGNPAAARVYGRHGWKFLPNSQVMLRVRSGDDGESFLRTYFDSGADLPAAVRAGDLSQRITMIPLILTPHEWVSLDANAELLSVGAARQESCMGLFPRYRTMESDGTWFAAVRDDGAAVGLASVKPIDGDLAQVDGFAHPRAKPAVATELFARAVAWARGAGFARVRCVCAVDDAAKRAALTGLGMRPSGERIQAGPEKNLVEMEALLAP